MKKAFTNTKVTVKLRKSEYREEWYLILEAYPVFKLGTTRASRVVEAVNRTITTPIWDRSRKARTIGGETKLLSKTTTEHFERVIFEPITSPCSRGLFFFLDVEIFFFFSIEFVFFFFYICSIE